MSGLEYVFLNLLFAQTHMLPMLSFSVLLTCALAAPVLRTPATKRGAQDEWIEGQNGVETALKEVRSI